MRSASRVIALILAAGALMGLTPVTGTHINDLEKGKFLLDPSRGYEVKVEADVVSSGNAITSTVDGSQRGLDTQQVNTGFLVSSNNSYDSSLGISAVFTGTWESVTKYPETTISLSGAPGVAPGTLFFEFANASPCSAAVAEVSVPYTIAGPNSFVQLPLRNMYPCFRVRYLNGSTALTSLKLVSVLHWQGAKAPTRLLNQPIDENEPVENIRAIQGGKSPNGGYVNLPATGELASQSSSTPLAAGATFNASGAVVDMSGYVSAAVTLVSNVSGASNGLVFHWYADALGTSELKTSTFTYGSPGVGSAFQVPRQGPYMRVTYTNGASAQASFHFTTRLFVTPPPSDVLSISETITGNTAAQTVKANIVGLQENGVYANTQLSNSGSLKVAIADRPSEIRNRTRVIITTENTDPTATCTLLHTVTAGKTLYIQSITTSAVNDSTANGRWGIYDNATLRVPFILTSRATGTPASSAATSPSLPEPIPFSTNFRICELGGIINASLVAVGYEE